MMMLLLRGRDAPPEPERTRNRTGICNIFKRAMATGQKVTLDEAIVILRAGW
jgi:hypothetical protein